MNLDFSKLDNITAPETPPPATEDGKPAPKLEWAKEDHRRTLEVYQRYQDSIKKSESLRAEILKGVQAGDAPETLLLKACEAISLMTGDSLFYNQIETKTQPQ